MLVLEERLVLGVVFPLTEVLAVDLVFVPLYPVLALLAVLVLEPEYVDLAGAVTTLFDVGLMTLVDTGAPTGHPFPKPPPLVIPPIGPGEANPPLELVIILLLL